MKISPVYNNYNIYQTKLKSAQTCSFAKRGEHEAPKNNRNYNRAKAFTLAFLCAALASICAARFENQDSKALEASYVAGELLPEDKQTPYPSTAPSLYVAPTPVPTLEPTPSPTPTQTPAPEISKEPIAPLDEIEATDIFEEELEEFDSSNTIKLSDGETFTIELDDSLQSQVDQFVNHYEHYGYMYRTVSDFLGNRIPPELIAAINFRETGCDFNLCLHDGTPIGQMISDWRGDRVFYSWEDAAVDALKPVSYTYKISGENLEECYELAEMYNGTGYRDRGLYTPYVYSGTSRYEKGMYKSAGEFDPEYKDPRPGVAVLLHALGYNPQPQKDNIADTAPQAVQVEE